MGEAGDKQRRVVGFLTVYVYDISATQPIPNWKDPETGAGPFEPAAWRMDPNEDVEEIFALVNAAVSFATKAGIAVDLEKEMSKEKGGYSAGGEIAVNKAYRGINQFSTLVHEIAHEVLHRDERMKPVEETRKDKEIDAETVAFIVLKHYGFDTPDSPNYIALWRGTGNEVKDRRRNIQIASKLIIEEIDKESNGRSAKASLRKWIRTNLKFAG